MNATQTLQEQSGSKSTISVMSHTQYMGYKGFKQQISKLLSTNCLVDCLSFFL